MSNEKEAVIKEIFGSSEKIEKIYKSVLLIYQNFSSDLFLASIRINCRAKTLDEKKVEILRFYSRLR